LSRIAMSLHTSKNKPSSKESSVLCIMEERVCSRRREVHQRNILAVYVTSEYTQSPIPNAALGLPCHRPNISFLSVQSPPKTLAFRFPCHRKCNPELNRFLKLS
jgi:hypothetical protein